ncbi:MAG: hypothetical protein Q4D38_12640 [Planctomycetia bacterium]|nr:hypothetical protein [Planctomycetia bacterium]
MARSHNPEICPSEDMLYEWVWDFCSEDKVLRHLRSCPECQRKWQFDSDFHAYEQFVSDYVLTEWDLLQIKEFLRGKIRYLKPWEALVNAILKARYPGDHYAFDLSGTRYMFCALAGYSSDKPDLNIIFSAVCSPDAHDYWKAILEIPRTLMGESTLSLHVVDGKDEPIPSGRFFLDELQFFPVKDGVAQIRHDEFLRNMKKHFVKFVFPDGTESLGKLSFF